MRKRLAKRAISILLSVLMVVSGIVPTMSALAGDGVEGYYDLQIFYKDTNTIVPTYAEDGVNEYIQYMHEGEELNLKYQLIDSVWPDNGYVRWHSESPALVDVTQEGVVKAFDSSKGAVVKAWINNEVRTIPLVGNIMGDAIEKVLFNDKVNLDSMDTEEIVDLVVAAFGSDSILSEYIEAYQGQLVDSLREYLDKVNTPIVCELFDAQGTLLATDMFKCTVLKNEEWYANFLPNGTHITNKNSVSTTQAKGGECQLYAITTPQRLGFGTVYSVKSSSIFETGKVVATVNDSGLVKFKNVGKATIMAAPDSEQVIQKILEMVNYFYELENTGTINTDKIANILIDYMGVDMNREALKLILDAAFAIKDIAGDVADPVQLTATAVEILANIILQMKYNDSITFKVIEAVPITNFDIDTMGVTSVKEGTQIQFGITNVQPDAGNVSDITWESSDPSIASVDPKTGVIKGLDAGGSLGSMSTNTVEIIATSQANKVKKTITITVTGKTGKFISHANIIGDDMVDIDAETDFGYQVFPARVAESTNLYTYWGMVTGEDEQGNEIISWANGEETVTDGIGQIDSRGHYKAVGGGKSTLVFRAVTGYYLSNGEFYEISSYTARKDISTGIPVEKITISCVDGTSNGDKNRDNIITVNGEDYNYVTIHKGVMEGYAGNGGKFQARIEPANATNQNITWVCDNKYYEEADKSEDTHNVSFKQKAGHEVADAFNVYAVSNDGKVVSNTVTVCVTRNYATNNVINEDTIELINGKQKEAYHTLSFDGSWTGEAYACYKANWYSSDEAVFTVESNINDNGDARITANDVGVATLYCVSTDGGIIDTAEVVVKPDKEFLRNIVTLCDKSVVVQTPENKAQYKQYMRKLDLAYAVLYDQDMASQTTCDTYAQNLLTAFYKLGGFVGIGNVDILGVNKTPLKSDFVSVKVGSTSNYKNYYYNLDYAVKPSTAMYSKVEWSSSSSDIAVTSDGKCYPTVNDPCSAMITCTVTDYMGNKASDYVYVAFARTQAKGVALNKTEINGGKVGETFKLEPIISPTNVLGNSTASVQNCIWETSNPAVATVDQNGVVTFVYGGDCTIYCTTQDGGFETSCAVNVVTNYDALQLLINQYNDLSLNPINFYPETWEIFTDAKAKAQAMIDKGGYKQEEVDAMYAELEASYKGLKKYTYIQNIELYLDGEQTQEFYQFDLSLLKEGISYKNAVLDLNVRLYPNNASYAEVVWESSTSDIAVTNDGKCSPTANKSCYGMITCTVSDHYGNSFKDSVWVSFSYVPVTALVLSDDVINGNVGETHQMSCVVEPTGGIVNIGDVISKKASIQDYFWESDDESVVTVDQDGLVTFVSAGSTKIRAVSYDGGIFAECEASTEGDRTVLKKALEDYKDVDNTLYEYEYGNRFLNAYQYAESILNDKGASQATIDTAAQQLIDSYNEMLQHPYVKPESINITYDDWKRPLAGSASKVSTGLVSEKNALSINLTDSKHSNYNEYNYVELNVTPYPSNAMVKATTIEVLENYQTTVSNNSGTYVKLTPSERKSGAWVKLKVTMTDYYNRSIDRVIYVSMSDNVATSLTMTPSEITLEATDNGYTPSASLSGNGNIEFKTLFWTSSDDAVATVSQEGVIQPVDKGECVITAKSLDGGYTASIRVTVLTDFQPLADKVGTYNTFINSVIHDKLYTEASLNALSEAVKEAEEMISQGTATQAQVNAKMTELDNAFNSLVKYEPVEGVKIGYEEAQEVSEPNAGYIRYLATSINGAELQLTRTLLPSETAIYKSIVWTSSDENVTVDSFGVVKNTNATPKYSVITCTVTDENDKEYSDSVVVSFVRQGVTAVTFDSEMVYGSVNETKQIVPNLNHKGTNLPLTRCMDCSFVSSDTSVATVDNKGNVTFVNQGTAIITVTSMDGGFVGTIEAYTTWDTTALKAAIDLASGITYTDYAYAYGMAFQDAYNRAVEVYENIYSTQEEIDTAVADLEIAMSDLEGNEYIYAQPTFEANGNALGNELSYAVNENNQVVVTVSYAENAMVYSSEWTVSNESNVTTQIDGNSVVITKTGDNATLDLTYTIVDDYGNPTEYTYSIKVVDALVSIESITLTVDGVQQGDTYTKGCGGTYTNFKGLQLGYIANPVGATDPVSVTWKSSAASYVIVSDTGFISLSAAGKVRASNTATITCTITNADGSTVTKSIKLTITRA